jgi:hypothetical protein
MSNPRLSAAAALSSTWRTASQVAATARTPAISALLAGQIRTFGLSGQVEDAFDPLEQRPAGADRVARVLLDRPKLALGKRRTVLDLQGEDERARAERERTSLGHVGKSDQPDVRVWTRGDVHQHRESPQHGRLM